MTNTKDIPRWAQSLGEETWERINDLLRDGWDTPDVMLKLGLPERKRRSLYVYARKFGPRRRLIRFAMFKDALLSGGADLGQEFVRALRLIAQKAVSPDVKDSTQLRAAELMVDFARQLTGMMASDEKTEREREREESGQPAAIDAHEVVRHILSVYGVRLGGGGDGGE